MSFSGAIILFNLVYFSVLDLLYNNDKMNYANKKIMRLLIIVLEALFILKYKVFESFTNYAVMGFIAIAIAEVIGIGLYKHKRGKAK